MNSGMETTALADILVDTSVWIAFFRKQLPYYETVLDALDADRISCLGIILGELLQGAKGAGEKKVLENFPQTLAFLPENLELWIKAGELCQNMRAKGITIGLADCYIATCAHAAAQTILTLDKHFKILAQKINIQLYPLESPV